jgi:hypothetical protein
MIPIFITIEEPDLLGIMPKATQAANEAGAKMWRDRMLPRHFDPHAKGRYGYKQRTRKYLMAKLRAASRGLCREGGIVDLVYSGQLKEYMTTTGITRATPRGATVTMKGPRYIQINGPAANHPDMREEILTVIEEEKSEIGRRMEVVLKEVLDLPEKHTSVVGFFHGE